MLRRRFGQYNRGYRKLPLRAGPTLAIKLSIHKPYKTVYIMTHQSYGSTIKDGLIGGVGGRLTRSRADLFGRTSLQRTSGNHNKDVMNEYVVTTSASVPRTLKMGAAVPGVRTFLNATPEPGF